VIDYVNSDRRAFFGTTRTLGGMFHVSKHLSLFYNNSNSFALPTVTRVFPDSKIADGAGSIGEDYGIALTLLDGRVYLRATTYTTAEDNRTAGHGFSGSTSVPASYFGPILDALVAAGSLTNAQADTHRMDVNGVIIDRTSKGHELSIVGNPTKNWRLQANYSYTDGHESNIAQELTDWNAKEKLFYAQFNQELTTSRSGLSIAEVLRLWEQQIVDQLAFEGLDFPGNRRHKVNVFTRYTFPSGHLKGLYIGGGYRHQSKMLSGRIRPAPYIPVYSPSYWTTDAVVGYHLKIPFLKQGVGLQLNVANVENNKEPLILQYFDPKNTADDNKRVARSTIRTPRTWRLSANIEL